MILVIPCAGDSTRFPTNRPKWLLTQPSGRLMVVESILGLDLSRVSRAVVVCRREHTAGVDLEAVSRSFLASGVIIPIEFHILEGRTASQPETVATFLRTLDEDTPIFVKDCDNSFKCEVTVGNSVCFEQAECLTHDISSKSYCKLRDLRVVETIAEKRVISNTFCVGGYGFASSDAFIRSFEAIKNHSSIYLSHVIDWMMLEGASFTGTPCSEYEDWGTYSAWLAYRRRHCTLFVDVDGVVLRNGSEFFECKWETTTALRENAGILRQMQATGRCQIIFTTARPERLREVTSLQLKSAGLDPSQLLMGLLHAHRRIVNDHSSSVLFPSCTSASILRDSSGLADALADLLDDNYIPSM
jgi:hypothetical protein